MYRSVNPLELHKMKETQESRDVVSDQQWRSMGENDGEMCGEITTPRGRPIKAPILCPLSVLVQ